MNWFRRQSFSVVESFHQNLDGLVAHLLLLVNPPLMSSHCWARKLPIRLKTKSGAWSSVTSTSDCQLFSGRVNLMKQHVTDKVIPCYFTCNLVMNELSITSWCESWHDFFLYFLLVCKYWHFWDQYELGSPCCLVVCRKNRGRYFKRICVRFMELRG